MKSAQLLANSKRIIQIMKTKIKHLILTGILGTALASQGATITVTDISPVQATAGTVDGTGSTGTFSTVTTSALYHNYLVSEPGIDFGDSATYGLKLTGMTIDGIAGVDLTWDLTVTAGGTGDINIYQNSDTWTADTSPFVHENEAVRVNSNETLTFSISNLAVTAPAGYVGSASFASFDGIEFDVGTAGVFTTATGVVSHDGIGSNFRTRHLDISFDVTVAVPEPSSTALLGLGGVAFALRRRRADS